MAGVSVEYGIRVWDPSLGSEYGIKEPNLSPMRGSLDGRIHWMGREWFCGFWVPRGSGRVGE